MKQKGRGSNLVLLLGALLLMLAGAALFFYPTLANRYAQRYQARVISSYQSAREKAAPEDLSALWDEAREYNDRLSGRLPALPFIPGSKNTPAASYSHALNPTGEGMMGYLTIPCIDVKLPIYHGCGEDALQRGAGHIEQTSLPIGGSGSHAMLSGHRGLPRAEMFSRLDEMEEGDIFLLTILDEVLAYETDLIVTIEPEQLEGYAARIPGEDLVTLVTCTPYGVNTHRLLVRGHRVDYVPETMEPSGSAIHVVRGEMNDGQRTLGIILGAVLVVLLVLIVLPGRKKKGGKYRG